MTTRPWFALALAAGCSLGHRDPGADAQLRNSSTGIDASAADASGYDLSCAGAPAGSAGSAVTISGTTNTVSLSGTESALAGVSLALVANATGAQLATTGPTDATGAWAFADEPTGGSALDVYIAATASGDRPTYVYPSAPLVADEANVPVVMLTNGQLVELWLGGAPSQRSGNGLLLVEVLDCQNAQISGATLSVEQDGAAVTGATVLALSKYSASLSGTFGVINVPPGATTVSASYGSAQLASHVVTAVANADTETEVLP